MAVRPVSLSDVSALFKLYRAVDDEGKYPARTTALCIETFERSLGQSVVNGWPMYIVEHAAHVVGSASVYPESFCRTGGDPRTGCLGMHVTQGLRRRGYGAALLAALVGSCRDLGFHAIELVVFESNIAARALYERFGFAWVEAVSPCTLGSGLIDHPVKMRLAL